MKSLFEANNLSHVKKIILFFISFSWVTIMTAQTYLYPGANLERLRRKDISKNSIQEWKWIKIELPFLGLNKYDTIADIGSHDGYYPLIYSIFSDSVTFYLNDITEEGFIYFDSIQTECNRIRENPISNNFSITIGDDTCTKLPSHLFTKVILRDVLHHFKQKEKMLADVKRILRPGPETKLLLFEPIRDLGDNKHLCAGAMTKEVLLETMKKNGFILSKEESPLRNTGSWFEFVLE